MKTAPMDTETIERKFYEVLGEVLGHSDANLDDEKTFRELGASEVDAMSIQIELELEFSIAIPDLESLGMSENAIHADTTVAECLAIVKAQQPISHNITAVPNGE